MLVSLFGMIRERRLWWMLPITIALLAILGLALLSTATPIAPLLYPLF